MKEWKERKSDDTMQKEEILNFPNIKSDFPYLQRFFLHSHLKIVHFYEF
jgi:hypothetical protein